MKTLSGAVVLTLLVPPQSPAPRTTPPVAGARTVLAAMVQAAEKKVLQGDALTEHYFRVAAKAARRLPADQQANALLLAMGIGLDDSDLMRKNPVTRELWH